MLRDEPIRQKGRDLPRQWSSDDYFDLIVWYELDGSIHGFQLCYDKLDKERAITWTRARGCDHRLIDTGSYVATSNQTPILSSVVPFYGAPVIAKFEQRAVNLQVEIRELVLAKLREFASAR